MKIGYASKYDKSKISGKSVHVKQFIDRAIDLGHELYTWPGNEHPRTQKIAGNRLKKLMLLRQLDVLYYRVGWRLPSLNYLMRPPFRWLLNTPVSVWEFNSVPEFGRVAGYSEADVRRAIEQLRDCGRFCDLAICVSAAIANYVQDNLGLTNVHVVPNGSDPDLFRPDVEPVPRIQSGPDVLNVVWIGSARLPWHDFDLLKRTATLLYERSRCRITFHIIGQGLRSTADMPNNVHYQGAETYDKLPHWLAAMDVGLCLYKPGPADYGSPLKAFDYMAGGLTVVGTHQPQLRELFEELRQLDLLVSPDAPSALADTLIGLANNRERVRQQGRAGRQLVVDKYNWRRAVRDTLYEMEKSVTRVNGQQARA